MVERDEQQGGHRHAGDRADQRQDQAFASCELPTERFALDLQCDEQEEDRHQAIVDPQEQRLGDGEIADTDLQGEIAECLVGVVCRGIRRDQCQYRRRDQGDAAGGFKPEELDQRVQRAR